MVMKMVKISKGQRLLVSSDDGKTWKKAIYERTRVNPSNASKKYMQVRMKDVGGRKTILISKSEIGNKFLVERA